MDLATLLGIVLGLLLICGSIVSGGAGSSFVHFPSMMITLGGTLSALLITYPAKKVKETLAIAKKSFKAPDLDVTPWYNTVMELAKVAKRDGMLALEERLATIDDAFLKLGVQMLADGTNPDVMATVLEQELMAMEERHMVGHSIFKNLGSYAPAFGMIGTLIGLVQMLRNLSDPSQIGQGMAVALLTTFYGAFFANLFCVPIQGKLEQRTAEEVTMKRMLLTGILSIQDGDSPRVVGQKLLTFVPPAKRGQLTDAAAA